jgi:hypothetical protein
MAATPLGEQLQRADILHDPQGHIVRSVNWLSCERHLCRRVVS